jgi:hypothetical protein
VGRETSAGRVNLEEWEPVRGCAAHAELLQVVHFTWPEITRASTQVVDSIQQAFSRGDRLA